jgi:hypothetical protein
MMTREESLDLDTALGGLADDEKCFAFCIRLSGGMEEVSVV